MALQAAQSGGDGEWMDREAWLKLAADEPLIAIILRGWGTTTVKESGKQLDTAQFDLFVLSGPQKGSVHLGESYFGLGIVTPLRRVSVGDEVAYRLKIKKNGTTEYAAADAPGDLPQSAIETFEELRQSGGSQPPAESSKKEPATAGAKSGGSKAKPSNFDDDPPF